MRNRHIFVAIKIKANDRSSNKYVKTQEYYNILLCILKKQVTSNFAAAKAPICDYPWLFVTILSLVKTVADTLKMSPLYPKQDLFDTNVGTTLG